MSPLATTEQRVLGLAKETVRGTPEAAPTDFRAILADTALDYKLNLLPDETKRKISAAFPAAAGTKVGTGSIKFPVRASEIGEFLAMFAGLPSSALDSAADAFKHTYTVPPAIGNITPQSYTQWLEYGVASKRYSLCNISELTFSGDAEGLAQMEAAVLFKSEDSDDTGVPAFTTESEEFTSYQADLKIDTVSNAQVKSYSFKAENLLFPQRTLNGSQDIKDLLAVGRHKLTGNFEIYLENLAERDKFLIGAQSALDFTLTGALIEDASFEKFRFVIPKIKYTNFAFQDMDGLLGVNAEWEAEYSVASGKLFDMELTNRKTSY